MKLVLIWFEHELIRSMHPKITECVRSSLDGMLADLFHSFTMEKTLSKKSHASVTISLKMPRRVPGGAKQMEQYRVTDIEMPKPINEVHVSNENHDDDDTTSE